MIHVPVDMASIEGSYTGMLMMKFAMLKTAALVIVLTLSVSANAIADSPKPVGRARRRSGGRFDRLEKQSGAEIVYRPELLKGCIQTV